MPSMQADRLTKDLELRIRALLDDQCLGVLATKDRDGHPYASLIAFAANSDHSELYFITPKATRKYDNITHDNRVALLINNSLNQPADFHAAMATTALGKARLMTDPERSTALPAYLKRHPYLDRFAHSPSCAMFAIEVTGFTTVQQFQNVSELRLDHELD
jgi:general stress protein 26